MTTMLETIAKAIYADLDKSGEYVGDDHDLKCTTLDGHFDLVSVARAVLAVLRDPTPEMVDALNSWAQCEGYIEKGWAAAIDVASGAATKGGEG